MIFIICQWEAITFLDSHPCYEVEALDYKHNLLSLILKIQLDTDVYIDYLFVPLF